VVKDFESNEPHSSMFHLGNIIQLVRDARSEINLKRLEIRDSRSEKTYKWSRNYYSSNERSN
jgi:hypothetical protein